ncbi:MAG: HAD family hydrolase [Pseudomonadota bacterium]
MSQPTQIAMWSGPRNISTAMMRSFEARGDCEVVDEPFYAAYLAASGAEHPLRDAVLASQATEPAAVVDGLGRPLADGRTLQYQKQMAHHMVFAIDEAWLGTVRHAFLVRDPAAMIASYLTMRTSVVADDLGLARQREIYESVVARTGQTPPVVDAADVLRDPPAVLAELCTSLDVAYSPAMQAWPPGRRPSDGVWAPHWYAAVERSTGFAPYVEREAKLPPAALRVLADCEPDYRFFFDRRIGA